MWDEDKVLRWSDKVSESEKMLVTLLFGTSLYLLGRRAGRRRALAEIRSLMR